MNVSSDTNLSGPLTVSANAVFTSNVFDLPILTVTASGHYGANAAGKTLYANTTAGITLTFGAASQSGFAITVVRGNTGNVTIANTTGVFRRNTASYTTANISNRYESATILYVATNEIVVIGSIT